MYILDFDSTENYKETRNIKVHFYKQESQSISKHVAYIGRQD